MNTQSTHPPKALSNTRRAGQKRAILGAALCACATLSSLNAAVILEADFNGTGSGTGGASDLVQSGGTGVTFSNGHTTVTTSTTDPLVAGAGSYLTADAQAGYSGNAGGVTITPTSSANSWAAMNTISGGTTSLHGAVDFLYRPESGNVAGSAYFDPISLGTPSATGLSLTLYNNGSDRIKMTINGGTGAFLTGASYTNVANTLYLDGNAKAQLVLGTTYHVAFTLSTDAETGVSTVNLFVRNNAEAIDPTSTDDLAATYKFKINGAVVTTGLPTGSFAFNAAMYIKPAVESYDTFRMYDSVPTTFDVVPEPSTFAMFGLGLAAMATLRRRRVAVKPSFQG